MTTDGVDLTDPAALRLALGKAVTERDWLAARVSALSRDLAAQNTRIAAVEKLRDHWRAGFPAERQASLLLTRALSVSDPGQDKEEADVCCNAQYGQNPERCYHEEGHPGPHSNRYGTTWAEGVRRG